VKLITELEKNFNEAIAGFFDVDEIRKMIERTDREAPVVPVPMTKVKIEKCLGRNLVAGKIVYNFF
jgi:hypothetical protein